MLREPVVPRSASQVFLDEVDSLLGRRDDGQVAEHHRATTNALLAWMDGFDGTGAKVPRGTAPSWQPGSSA